MLDTAEVTASPTVIVDDDASEGKTSSEGSSKVNPSPLSRSNLVGVFVICDLDVGDGNVFMDRMLGEDNLRDSPPSLFDLVPLRFGASDEDEGDRGTEGEP